MRQFPGFGLLVVLAALLACKKRDDASNLAALSAQPAASEVAPSVVADPRRTEVQPLAKQLDAITRDPKAFSTGKDSSGAKTVTFSLKPIDGVELAEFVGYRKEAKAWRFGLEGMQCDRIGELGLEVVELQRGDGRPLSASWYRIEGGPLSKLLVKVFPGASAGLCNVMPGTPPYWEHQGEKTPE